MIHVTVRERDAQAQATEPITTGSVGLPVRFRFSEDWEGLARCAVFQGGGQSVDMALENGACAVPHEVLQSAGGHLKIGVYGTGSSGQRVTPTVWADAGPILPGAEPANVEATPATQTLIQRLLEAAEAVKNLDDTLTVSGAAADAKAVGDALDGALLVRSNVTAAGSGDFRDSLSKPGMYFKFSGEVTGGVNAHSARILLFRSPNDEYGKLLVWVDGVTGSVYTCVYRGPATGTWTDWVQLPGMGEVTGALAAKLDKNQGSGSAGKVMKVGSDGTLAPAAPAVRSFSKSIVGGHEVFSVGYGVSGPMGEMETTGSILPATETYRKDEVDAALAAKLDQNQGSGSAGKVMKVGSDGTLAPAAPAVRSFSKSIVGGHEVFSVGYGVSGPMGEMETTGSILPASETYRKDEVDAALAAKYSKPSGGIPGTDLASGVVPKIFEITCTPTALDYSGTMNKTPQEIAAAYARGDRIVATIPNVATAELALVFTSGSFVFWAFVNTTLVVMKTSINLSQYSTQLFELAVDGSLNNSGQPADAYATGVAIAAKLDANLGAANAGKFLVVGNDGVVVPVTMSAWQGGNY